MKKIALLVLILCLWTMAKAQTYVLSGTEATIGSSTAGCLQTVIPTADKLLITTLKVSGLIDARDIKEIRDSLPALTTLDLFETDITDYSGSGGTSSTSTTYARNVFPEHGLTGRSSITSIIFPSKLTRIDNVAIEQVGISTVSNLPLSLRSIGMRAFSGCDNLTDVVLPPNLETIGVKAFATNQSLVSVTLPLTMLAIESDAFNDCSSLRTVNIHVQNPSVVTLGNDVFDSNCLSYGTLHVPEGTLSVYSTFPSTPPITIATTWNRFTTIQDDLPIHYQMDDERAYLIDISPGFVSAGGIPARDMYKIKELYIEGAFDATDIRFIRDNLYELRRLELGKASIAAYSGTNGTKVGVNRTYDANVFPIMGLKNEKFRYLQDLILPHTLTAIDSMAFEECNLNTVTIYEGVTRIGASAFNNCQNLQHVELPSTLTSIESNAFLGCTSLSTLEAHSATPVTLTTGNTVFSDIYSNCLLRVPDASYSLYSTAPVWQNFQKRSAGFINPYITTNSVSNITSYTAQANGVVIQLGDATPIESGFVWSKSPNPTRSDSSALATGVPTVNAPFNATMTNLSPRTFYYVRAFVRNQSSTPELGTVYGDQAYLSTPVYVNVNGTTGTIDGFYSGALKGAGLLTAAQKSSMTTLTLIGTIDARDFKIIRDSMPNLTHLDLSRATIVAYTGTDGTVSGTYTYAANLLPYMAFFNHSNLKSVSIPTSCTDIGAIAFNQCTGLTSILIPASITSIGSNAFSGCTSLSVVKACSATPINLSSSTTVFGGVPLSTCLLRIPAGSRTTYSSANQWSAFVNMVEGLVPPAVSTEAVTNLTATSVTFHGLVTDLGDSTSTQHGFVWSKNPSPTVSTDSTTTLGAPTQLGSFESSVTGLSPNTTYYVRAYATNPASSTEVGTVYGGEKTVITPTSVVIDETTATIDGINAGSLIGSSVLTSSQKSSLTSMTIIGTLDARDFKVIRDSMPNLTSLNLSGATIAAYTGANGTIVPAQSSAYPANELPVYAFYAKENNGRFNSITLPTSLTAIGDYAFGGCSSLSSISIPSTVTSIGSGAFSWCSKLSAVTLPPSLTLIEADVFKACTSLTSITIPSTVTSIGGGAFYNCAKLETITIPTSVITIGSYAFAHCTALSSINLPASITLIDDYSFTYCKGLKSIVIPSSVATIGIHAFERCDSLKTVDIPASVTSIGELSFFMCGQLSLFKARRATPVNLSSVGAVFGSVPQSTCLLRVPSGSLNNYRNAIQWKDFANIVEGIDPPSITTKAVSGILDTTATVNGSIDDFKYASPIQHGFVWSTTHLPTISNGKMALGAPTQLSDYSTTIGELNPGTTYYVRAYVTNPASNDEAGTVYGNEVSFTTKTSIDFDGTSGTVTGATSGVLSGASLLTAAQKATLTSLTITGTIDARDIKIIRDSMPLLTHLDLSGATIAAYTGSEGTLSGTNTYDAGVIPDNAFFNRSSLVSASIPTSSIAIGNNAFNGCSGLTSFTIPASVTSIGNSAFSNCTGLTLLNAGAATPIDLSSSSSVFNGIPLSTCVLQVPAGSFQQYSQTSPWNAFTHIVEGFSSPAVSTQAAAAIKAKSATLHGTIVTLGDGVSQHGFVWGTTHLPTISDADTTALGSPAQAAPFESSVTGLLPNTTYYVRSYASRLASIPEFGTVYGDEVSFTTPTFVDIIGTNATINGSNAGSLVGTTLMSNAQRSSLTSLTITGTLDARDFKVIRDSMPNLTSLVISGVTIAAYTGADGTKVPIQSATYLSNELPAYAFYKEQNNGRFSNITLPTSLTSIATYAFKGCSLLTNLPIPSTVSTIGSYAFKNCASLTTISIPELVTRIEAYTFDSCMALTSVTLPSTVNFISSFVFKKCTNLANIQLPSSLTSIGTGAFNNCSSLPSITIPSNVTFIGAGAFAYCTSMASITIPTSVTRLTGNAFDHCTSLTSIELPSSITKIESSLLSYCIRLKSIVIPSSITSIEYRAFANCDSLNSVVIPASVTSIGSEAFLSCRRLTSIKVYSPNPVDLSGSSSVFYNVPLSTCVLRVPAGTHLAYMAANQWGDFSTIVEGYESPSVSTGAATNIKPYSVDLSGTLVGLGDSLATDYGFVYGKTMAPTISNDSIASLGAPTQIGAYSASLSKLSPGTIYFVRSYAYNPASNLEAGTVYGGLVYFTTPAFVDINGTMATINGITAGDLKGTTLLTADQKSTLTRLTLTGTIDARDIKVIRDNMPNLTHLDISGATILDYTGTEGTLPGTNTYATNRLPDNAFLNHYNLESIIIPTNCTAIGNHAFNGCNKLKSIYIPTTVTAIGNSAFSNCTSLNLIKASSSTPINLSSSTTVFYGVQLSTCLLRIPTGAYSSYNSANQWNTFAKIVEGLEPPSISTQPVTAITENSAILHGMISDLADTATIQHGFVWSKNRFPTISNGSKSTLGKPTQTGTFTSTISGLSAGTTYYVRSYATNTAKLAESGTVYGEEISFITKPTITNDGTAYTINYAYAGVLNGETILSKAQKTLLTSLTITGKLDARDFKVIRDSMPNLTSLIISGVTIAAYSGSNGTVVPAGSYTYPANELPVYAFYEKDNKGRFSSISVPTSLTSIGTYAFKGCSLLSTINVPSTVATIGSNAFDACFSLTSVSLSGPMTRIESSTFDSCTHLTSVTIPSTVTSLGSKAFYACSKLNSILLPPELTTIESMAFSNTGINAISIPSSVTTIGSSAFNECYNLTAITIPSSVTTVGSGVFMFCTRLTSVNLPSSINTIEKRTFYSCSSLRSIVIPSSVTSIMYEAFSHCDSLETVVIPVSVTSIETSSFAFCNRLSEIKAYKKSPVELSQSTQVFDGVPFSTCLLRVPSGSMESYQKANQWSSFVNIVEGFIPPVVSTQEVTGITAIRANLNCTMVNLGDTVVSDFGFVWGLNSIPTVTTATKFSLGTPKETNTFIGTLNQLTPGTTHYVRSFAYNKASNVETGTVYGEVVSFTTLTAVDINGTACTITGAGAGALMGSTLLTPEQKSSLTSLTINGTIDARDIKVIRDNMPKLTHLELAGATIAAYTGTDGTLAGSITYGAHQLPGDAFLNHSNLAVINLPASVTSIGSRAFMGCSSVSSLTIPLNTSSINSDAFNDCTSLAQFNVPDENSAFHSLNGVLFSKDVATLYAYPNKKDSVYVIPDGVKTISPSAFYGCAKLTSVTIPATTTSIGNYAFSNCTKLKVIVSKRSTPCNISLVLSVFKDVPVSTCLLRVPNNAMPNYKAANQWNAFTNIVEGLVPPVISTQAVSNITPSSPFTATGNGVITKSGDVAPVKHGFVWSTDINPTTALPTKTEQAGSPGSNPFSLSMSKLRPGTIYYVRAYTVNKASNDAAGTVYGDAVAFKTEVSQITVTSLPVLGKKIFDGSNKGTVDSLGRFEGIHPEDSLSLQISATAEFSTPTTGTGKAVKVVYTLSGPLASNYQAPKELILTNGEIDKALSLRFMLEALWNHASLRMNKRQVYDPIENACIDKYPDDIVDLVTVELHGTSYKTFSLKLDSLQLHQDGRVTSKGLSAIAIPSTLSGSYYLTVKNWNHLPASSAYTIPFNDNTVNYDFTDDVTKAYFSFYSVNPMIETNKKWMLYGGSISNDDIGYSEIDNADLYQVFNNKSSTPEESLLIYDIDGNGSVDDVDVYAVFNNRYVLFYIP